MVALFYSRKARSAFFFPRAAVRRAARKIRILTNRIKYDQDLAGHIHPSLVVSIYIYKLFGKLNHSNS